MEGGKKIIYYFLATNMPLHFWGLDGEKSIRKLQRGQVFFLHYLHSHSLAGCFLCAALPQAFNLETTFGFCEFSVDDKFFGARVLDPNEWMGMQNDRKFGFSLVFIVLHPLKEVLTCRLCTLPCITLIKPMSSYPKDLIS